MKIDTQKFDKGEVQGYINNISCKASALGALLNEANTQAWKEHQVWGLASMLEDIADDLCKVNNCIDNLKNEEQEGGADHV